MSELPWLSLVARCVTLVSGFAGQVELALGAVNFSYVDSGQAL